MTIINFMEDIPEELAETVKLGDLWETACAQKNWQEYEAEVLDYIYRRRVARSFETMATTEEIADLQMHLNKMTHADILQNMKDMEKQYGERWEAFKDLLGDRYQALTSPVPEEILKYKHVIEILKIIYGTDEVARSEVKLKLGVKSPNLTRILDLMEANELIERRKRGNEIFLRIGTNGLRLKTTVLGATTGDEDNKSDNTQNEPQRPTRWIHELTYKVAS